MIANCLRDAQANVDAVKRGDVDAMVRYLHPAAITGGIGNERTKDKVRSSLAQMEREGSRITSITLGTPARTITGGSRHFAIVPEACVFRVKDTLNVSADSFLLGISEDAGKSWRFIDGAGVKKFDLAKVLPEYPLDQHPLPAPTKPRVEMDAE